MHFDASAIIHAWDNYPIANFPAFWDWVEVAIRSEKFAMSEIAFVEVKNKTPDCGEWLKNKGIRKIPLSDEVLVKAAEIKGILGIIAENYHSNGVGENDLLIVSAAYIENAVLLTEESRQNILPTQKRRYKIPSVCALDEVAVICSNVRELIATSGVVFR